MVERKPNLYLVDEEVLPEAIKKTIKVKEMLTKGEVKTVNDAVAKLDFSRSAYYKYKDSVFPFYEASKAKIITIFLLLEHRPGVLSRTLNAIANADGNVLTINQGIPLQGLAHVSISIETMEMKISAVELVNKIQELDGVRKLEIIGQS